MENSSSLSLFTSYYSLEEDIGRFSEVEEVKISHTSNPFDVVAENHFVKTYRSNESKKYVLSLLFKLDIFLLKILKVLPLHRTKDVKTP